MRTARTLSVVCALSGALCYWATPVDAADYWLGGAGNDIYYSAGKVGVGTSTPGVTLHALLNTNDVDIIRASTNAHSIGLGIDGTGTYWGASLFQDGTKRFTVESNGGILVGGDYQGYDAPANGAIIEGKVGIGTGTATPSHLLDVRGEMRITRGGGSTYSYDVHIQGGAAADGDDRNLALVGEDETHGDRLHVNYNGEYAGGTIMRTGRRRLLPVRREPSGSFGHPPLLVRIRKR